MNIHGLTNTPIWHSWRGMIERCTNPNHVRFHRYGGRGIAVCGRWLKFTCFSADMKDRWYPGATLERIDNAQGYDKSNCRWATRKEQALNTCRTHVIDTPWGRMPLGDAAERSGIHRTTIYSRIKAGTNPFR